LHKESNAAEAIRSKICKEKSSQVAIIDDDGVPCCIMSSSITIKWMSWSYTKFEVRRRHCINTGKHLQMITLHCLSNRNSEKTRSANNKKSSKWYIIKESLFAHQSKYPDNDNWTSSITPKLYLLIFCKSSFFLIHLKIHNACCLIGSYYCWIYFVPALSF
jgi:hypothetical protein